MKGTKSVILTFSGNIEAVDSGERRTISGKIAPYGEVGYTSAGKVVFAEGSISAPEPSRVKLLMSHDNSKPVGRMQSITSAKDGLYASFKVSASSRGSDAILLAQEQLMDGLSVGVEVTASEPKKIISWSPLPPYVRCHSLRALLLLALRCKKLLQLQAICQ